MKAVRADWAATTPWEGIQGRPALPGSADFTALKQKVAILQAQVAALASAIANLPPLPTPPAVLPFVGAGIFQAAWTPGTLHPLQSATHDVTLPAFNASYPVLAVAPYDLDLVNLTALALDLHTVRLVLINLGNADVTLGAGNWRIFTFAPPS